MVVSDAVRLLWGYRRAFVVTLAVAALIVAVAGIVAYLAAPSNRITALRFRLEFEGAQNGLYPSDIKFSTHDITSDPVLKQVFEANNLDRFFRYREFADSVFVYETSTALELLMREYEAKLSNVKLSPVDRSRIEATFKTKKEELASPEYELQLQRPGGVTAIPPEVESKVVSEILSSWADWAKVRKGAMQYNIPLYSSKIIQVGLFESSEYLIAADLLRTDIERILENVGELESLPGSHTIFAGEERVTLADIKAGLDELRQFKLDPLISLIAQTQLARDSEIVSIYLENRLFNSMLELEEAKERVQVLEDAITRFLDQGGSGAPHGVEGNGSGPPQDVTTYVSQFNDPFLDRLLNMATRNQDAELRQQITKQQIMEGDKVALLTKQTEYYRALRDTFSARPPRPALRNRAAAVDRLKKDFERLETETLNALVLISSLFDQISSYNLNPRNLLYSTLSPVSFRQTRGASITDLALYSMLTLGLVTLLFPVGCLLHYNLSRVRARDRTDQDT